MAKSIIVTIPIPCHEKWSEMTPADRGRFCAACQKTVRDFTFATDSEIANAVHSNKNLCGRFTSSQLDRKLYLKQPARKPYAVAAGIAALLGIGGYEANAQEPVKTEKQENTNHSDVTENSKKMLVKGVVFDETGLPFPAVMVLNINSKESVQADFDGKYAITAHRGDVLRFQYFGAATQELIVKDSDIIDIIFIEETYLLQGDVIIVDKRNFFSRIFHRIGNWFR